MNINYPPEERRKYLEQNLKEIKHNSIISSEHINEGLKGLCVDKDFDVEALLWVTSKGEYDEITSNSSIK